MNKSFISKITWIAIIGILLVSLIPNVYSDYWLIDIFSNFKVQYLFISILLLITASLVLKKKVLALFLIAISILWNAYYIAPYYLNANVVESKNDSNFKISSINLLSSNSETESVKNYIKTENPDILVFLEFTPRWESELLPIIEKYPYKKLVSRTDNFGIALLSKFEMKSSIDYFGLNIKPSIIGELKIKNDNYSLIATHPIPPINQKTFENRNKQLSNIIDRRSSFSDNLIVIGDFNTSSFSNHFNSLLEGDLKDSRIGFGLLPTWPANYNILQTTIDHCLVSNNLDVLDRSTGENLGSDHLPINIIIRVN